MVQPANQIPTNGDTRPKILVVDDEAELTSALCDMLNRQGYQAVGFSGANEALDALKDQEFDILLADLMMPEVDGITLLKSALQIEPNLIGIIMTGQGTVQTAVEAMKSGAFDYLLKPFKLGSVLTTINRSLEVRKLRIENFHLREMVSIYELGQVVALTLDQSLIFQKTVEAAVQQMDADEASILLPDPDENGLVLTQAYGEHIEKLVGKIVPVEGTIAGWVAAHQEPLMLNGVVHDPRFTPVYPRPEIQSAISMPMVLHNKLIGIININQTRSPQPLTQRQITTLSILVGIATSAVENARLYKETEKQIRQLTALRTIDLAISSSLDLRVTLNVFLDQVSSELGVDAAAVFLFNAQTQMLEYAAGRGFRRATLDNAAVLLGTGYAGRAALERRTIRLDHDMPSPYQEALSAEEEIQSGYATPLIAKGEVQGVLEVFHRSELKVSTDWLGFLESLAGQAAIAIDNARLFENLQRSNQQLTLAYNATIEGWSRALDLRDHETEGHTRRVAEMTVQLATAMGVFNEEELIQIRRGALLHDIGKMGVPDSILLKPGELTAEEEAQMHKHPEYAYQFLSPILYLHRALEIPYSHHESWDGSGYPQGLKGEQIPLAARIFSVVDVWDALCSDRPYRTGWPEEKVLEYIQERAGTQFDPRVAEFFVNYVRAKRG
jgi:response regulator RpfG family c-di-GMP phosphodiesterase/putative methionine-R-sulfoxide reductase with GAF domain